MCAQFQISAWLDGPVQAAAQDHRAQRPRGAGEEAADQGEAEQGPARLDHAERDLGGDRGGQRGQWNRPPAVDQGGDGEGHDRGHRVEQAGDQDGGEEIHAATLTAFAQESTPGDPGYSQEGLMLSVPGQAMRKRAEIEAAEAAARADQRRREDEAIAFMLDAFVAAVDEPDPAAFGQLRFRFKSAQIAAAAMVGKMAPGNDRNWLVSFLKLTDVWAGMAEVPARRDTAAIAAALCAEAIRDARGLKLGRP